MGSVIRDIQGSTETAIMRARLPIRKGPAMPRLLLVLPLLLSTAVLPAQTSRESAKADDGNVVTMRGCVSGSLLKSNGPGPANVAGTPTQSDRYRMIGSKTVKAQIKKANRKYVVVTGRIQPGPKAMVKGTKMGGTTIGIGVTQGTSSATEVPYTPTIEVESIDVITQTCDS
jgi:hypothetical protein